MLSPWDLGRVGFRIESDFLTVHEDSMFPEFNVVWESVVCGVIGEEILEVLRVHEGIIDTGDADSSWVFEGGPENETTDAAETIYSNHCLKISLI